MNRGTPSASPSLPVSGGCIRLRRYWGQVSELTGVHVERVSKRAGRGMGGGEGGWGRGGGRGKIGGRAALKGLHVLILHSC